MKPVADLNSDLGEGAGYDNELLRLVTSANITCGFHVGDSASILRSIRDAKECGVSVGAHPSFADRENFGRKELTLKPAEIFSLVTYQLGAFSALAGAAETRMNHVKPHGALYNMAARDRQIAEAIVSAMVVVDPYLILFAPANSELERAGKAEQFNVVCEVFADRNYQSDGSLVPRSRPDALLKDPQAAAKRILRMLQEGKVESVEGHDVDIRAETVCVHGDTPGAVDFVRVLRSELEANGVDVRAPERSYERQSQ
jgi:5-oxoprolinase (ATP-hydrolysing) subunit A